VQEKEGNRYIEEAEVEPELKNEKGKNKRKSKNKEFDVSQLPKDPR